MNKEPTGNSDAVSIKLLELLRCPVTRAPLRLEGNELVSTSDGRRYPIRDGIPVLVPEAGVLPTAGTTAHADGSS